MLHFWLSSKEFACNAGDLGLIPGSGRSPGGGHGNPLHYSCLENSHGQRSLADFSPWHRKELDMTEATQHACILKNYQVLKIGYKHTHVIWNSRKILKDTKKRAPFLLQSLVLVSEALEGANVPRTTVLSSKINISIYVQSCPALALSLRNMSWSCPLSAPQPWPFFPSVIHDLV